MLKKNQKKINQRIGLIFSMLLLMINTAGCGLKKNTNNNDIVPEASVKNVYSKNIIELPDNSEIQSISKSNTSGIYVVGKQSDNMQSVWYMNKNDEWERKYDINQVLNIDKEAYCKAYVSPDGYKLGIFLRNHIKYYRDNKLDDYKINRFKSIDKSI